MPVFVTIAGLFVGLLLIYLGWRGRRLSDHPVCRRCGYDLFGRETACCAECGSDLGARRAVRQGEYRRQWWVIVTGLVALGVVASVDTWRAVLHGFDWGAQSPVWLLNAQTQLDGELGYAALDELMKRMQSGLLSTRDEQSLFEEALRRQGSGTAAWTPQWGDLLVCGWDMGTLTRPQLERYLKQAIDPTVETTWRERVQAGGMLPLRCDAGDFRASALQAFRVQIEADAIQIGEHVVPIVESGRSNTMVASGHRLRSRALALVPPGVAAGRHTVRIDWRITLSRSLAGMNRQSGPSWIVSEHAEVEVVSPSEPLVELVDDPALRADVVSSVWIKRVDVTPSDGQSYVVNTEFDIVRPPVDVAWNVEISDGTKRVPLSGSLKARAGGTTSIGLTARMELSSVDAAVGILLRPGPPLAARTVDMTRIWGEDVLIEDVPLRRDGWRSRWYDLPVAPADERAAMLSALDHFDEWLVLKDEDAYATGFVVFDPTPVAVDASIYWRVGEREWRVGQVRSGAGGCDREHYQARLEGFDPATRVIQLVLKSKGQEAVVISPVRLGPPRGTWPLRLESPPAGGGAGRDGPAS